jgi:hypothetical protein
MPGKTGVQSQGNKSMTKLTTAAFALSLMAGCAHQPYQAVAPGSTEPTASVADTVNWVSGNRAQTFIVQSVDGHRIGNSMDASQDASRNHGAALTVPKVERPLPLRTMQVTLEGRDIAAMPIAELFGSLSGRYHAVEGVVAFAPLADHRYAVVGALGKESSSIWIEDVETHLPVTDKVTAK